MTSMTLTSNRSTLATWMPTLCVAVALALFLFSPDTFAGSSGAAGAASTKVNSFFTSIQGILNTVSVVVITIAIIFAGYQIAFAHKRISDVAPILIGALLIGGASQIAAMLLA